MKLLQKIFSWLTSSHYHHTSTSARALQASLSCLFYQVRLVRRDTCLRKRDSSPSPAESNMDDDASNGFRRHRRRRSRQSSATVDHRRAGFGPADEGDDSGGEAEEGSAEVWETFNDSFRQVQSVLDRNRVLIQQVNENHQSKIPDNLVKNVALIQEINGNISKVVSLYSDLSTNFSGVFHQPNENENGTVVAKKGSVKGKNTEAWVDKKFLRLNSSYL